MDGTAGHLLEDLFVLPEFRGLGIGKALLRQVAAIALEKGCQRLQWEVLDWNTPAIDFYRAMGADFLDEWRNVRLGGEALTRLAEGAEGRLGRLRQSRKIERRPRRMRIRVIGGGLAGSEAALTAVRLGCQVDLYEMRAVVDGKSRLTPAHQTTGVRRAGLLQLAQERVAQHRALAAEAGDAARGLCALANRGRDRRPCGPRAGGGSFGVFAADWRGDRRGAGIRVIREEVTSLGTRSAETRTVTSAAWLPPGH